jgi:hypothetical protein
MAYLIINDGDNLYKIASNETEKNEINCTFPPYTTIDISDADFLKIKQNTADVTISNGSATVVDNSDLLSSSSLPEELVKPANENTIKLLESFLNEDSNSSKSLYPICQTYHNYLKNLDYSSITFPITGKTWEQYCEDNSITYVNTLQIP